MNRYLISLLLVLLGFQQFTYGQVNFMEDNPNLEQFLYQPPTTNVYFGYGVAPISIMKSKVYFSANLFQVHWIKGMWDLELFSVSIGKTLTKEPRDSSAHFTFRVAPKVKVFKNFSIGPVFGYEVVRFENIKTRLFKGSAVTTDHTQTYTSGGPIYGVMFSQMFSFKDNDKVKLNQIFYQQTYSVTETDYGWEYLFEDEALRNSEDKDEIAPGLVFLLEANFLF